MQFINDSNCRPNGLGLVVVMAAMLSCSSGTNTSSRGTGESSDATRIDPFSSDGASDPAPTSGAYLAEVGSHTSTTKSTSGDPVLTFTAPDGTVGYNGNRSVIKMSAAIVDAKSLAQALKTRVGKSLVLKPLAYRIFSPNERGGFESSLPFGKPGLLIIQIGGSLSGVHLVTPPVALLKNPLSDSPSTLLHEKADADIDVNVTAFIKHLAALNSSILPNGNVDSASLLEGTSRLSSIAVGNGFTVFIANSGRVYSFGSNYYDANENVTSSSMNGRLGSLEGTRAIAAQIICLADCGDDNPFLINSKARADQVVAGANHACALFSGMVWCWGSNLYGQIGNVGGGINNAPNLPKRVSMPEGIIINSISAGSNHTCAVAMNGQAYCWGLNSMQQSNPHPAYCTSSAFPPQFPCAVVPIPNPIPDPLPDAQSPVPAHMMFTRIGAGKDFSCGISAGQIWCWGAGASGKLGVALPAGAQNTVSTGNPIGPLNVYNSDAAHFEVGNFQSLSLGESHGCALATDQKAYCWGNNAMWQTGSSFILPSGIIAAALVDSPFDAVRGLRVEARGNTSFGIDVNGRAWGWGSNAGAKLACAPACVAQVVPSGRVQLGREELDFNGATPYQPTFVEVATSPDDLATIASCGRVVGGDIFCWGAPALLGYGGIIPPPLAELGRIHRIKMPE